MILPSGERRSRCLFTKKERDDTEFNRVVYLLLFRNCSRRSSRSNRSDRTEDERPVANEGVWIATRLIELRGRATRRSVISRLLRVGMKEGGETGETQVRFYAEKSVSFVQRSRAPASGLSSAIATRDSIRSVGELILSLAYQVARAL